MLTMNSRLVLLSVLGLGVVCGTALYQASQVTWAEEPRSIQPAVAEPATTPRGTLTPAEHLRRAAEHLEAAGEASLAQHVRDLAGRPDRLPTTTPRRNRSTENAGAWLDSPQSNSPARLPNPSPLWKMQVELPAELDDGHLRYVQPARNQLEIREVRATPAPQRDPI